MSIVHGVRIENFGHFLELKEKFSSYRSKFVQLKAIFWRKFHKKALIIVNTRKFFFSKNKQQKVVR